MTAGINRLGQPIRLTFLPLAALFLSACGSSSDDGAGFVKFYNGSPNAPDVFLTLDEDLDSDADDEFEQTFSSVGYGSALSNREVPEGQYFYELGWQDEDSSARSDLEIIAESTLQIRNESMTLVVMSNDIETPEITFFDVAVIDDDDDVDNDLFNLRFLNVSVDNPQVDLYMSKSDETFNEAELMGTLDYLSLTDNVKLEEDQYIFYITAPGSTDVLFESTEVSYQFSSQYVVMVRPSDGAGSTPFVIDNVGNSSVATYQAVDAEARFRVYNGMQTNDLLPEYTGMIDVNFSGFSGSEIPQVSDLSIGEFSTAFTVDNGDYSMSVDNAIDDINLVNSQLLSLPENTDRTVFLYMVEEYVDEDGDGDYDEDGDGQIDEIEAKLATAIVANSTRDRIYDHEVKVLNLVYNEDIARVTFYFVKSDEIIETAEQRRSTTLGNPETLVLLNNTYDVFAIATIDGTDIILDNQTLTLDEESDEQFLLLESDIASATGYRMRFVSQIVE